MRTRSHHTSVRGNSVGYNKAEAFLEEGVGDKVESFVGESQEVKRKGKEHYANNREEVNRKREAKRIINKRRKELYPKHREKFLLIQKEIRAKRNAKQREEVVRKKKEYYVKNREELKRKQKEYYANNREAINRERKAKRIAKKGGDVEPSIVKKLTHLEHKKRNAKLNAKHYANNREEINRKKRDRYAKNREEINRKRLAKWNAEDRRDVESIVGSKQKEELTVVLIDDDDDSGNNDFSGDEEQVIEVIDLVDTDDDKQLVLILTKHIAVRESEYTNRYEERVREGQQDIVPDNDISPSSVDPIEFTLHTGIMDPTHTSMNTILLEQLTWTPISPKKETMESQQIRISRRSYDKLAPPYWLDDEVLDFLISYLFRGTSKSDTHFSYRPCSFFTSIVTFGLKRRKSSRLSPFFFQRDLIFIPINLGKKHWVLAMIVKPTMVGTSQSPTCIVYLDPLHPHLSKNQKRKVEGEKARSHIHDVLLKWLNHELVVGKECQCGFNRQNCEILFEFGSKGELL